MKVIQILCILLIFHFRCSNKESYWDTLANTEFDDWKICLKEIKGDSCVIKIINNKTYYDILISNNVISSKKEFAQYLKEGKVDSRFLKPDQLFVIKGFCPDAIFKLNKQDLFNMYINDNNFIVLPITDPDFASVCYSLQNLNYIIAADDYSGYHYFLTLDEAKKEIFDRNKLHNLLKSKND